VWLAASTLRRSTLADRQHRDCGDGLDVAGPGADLVSRMPGYDTNVGAKRAREARARLGLDDASPVPCVVTFAEERAGLPVVVAGLPDEVAGALWREGGSAMIWINGRQAVERQRFTVAHELGHLYCRHDDTTVDTAATLSAAERDPREVQANAFAAELLAPRAGVVAMVGGQPALDDLVRLAAHFGVSTLAALNRCRTLGLVERRRAERLHREIEEGLHHEVWEYVRPDRVEDVLARIEEYPRLPRALAGSALSALLRGETTAAAAALAAGCGVDRLEAAATALVR
jgi:Zn-dependent peptidase ImmA (M78 family)